MRMLRWLTGVVAGGLIAIPAWAGVSFEMTPAIQKELDKQIEAVKLWAANPVVVNAVLAQNQKGPIPGMDNAKWKTVSANDDLVKSFQFNAAGKFFEAKTALSDGYYSEAFLSAAQGEKVAFFEKTTSYIHKGAAKFDVPFNTGKAWQGPPEYDESARRNQIQVSVPVLSEGKHVGVLVVGIGLDQLAILAKK